MNMRVQIALAAAALLATIQGATAQGVGVGGGVAGSAGVITSPLQPAAPAVGGVATTPGVTTAPSGVTTGTSAPAIGTRAPSGLPGDNPDAPGFPGRVGR